jgi:hypothetical protein
VGLGRDAKNKDDISARTDGRMIVTQHLRIQVSTLFIVMLAGLTTLSVGCAGKPAKPTTDKYVAESAKTPVAPAPTDPRALMPESYDGEPVVPLGWSAEGTFAYVVVEEEIGRGGFSVHLGLQGVSDPFEYAESVFYHDVEQLRDLEVESDFRRIIDEAVELWHEELAEAHVAIHANDVLEPRRFPYERDGVNYLPDFTVVRSGEDSPYDTIAAYDVTIRSTDGRHKLVFTREPSATQVEGGWYYLAPTEGVVAMVVLERRQVFGENRMNAHPAVTVIDLASGFESDQ